MEEPINVLEVEMPLNVDEMLMVKEKPNSKMAKKWKRLLDKAMKKQGCYFSMLDNDYLWLEPTVAEAIDCYPQIYPIEYLIWIYGLQPQTDSFYIRSDEEGVFEKIIKELIERLYENCNTLVIISKLEINEEMQTLMEYIYQDSGLVVSVVEEIPLIATIKTFNNRELPPIFFDFSRRKVEYRNFQTELEYIDLAPTKQKYRVIKEKRKKVRYSNYSNYLNY